MSQQSHSCVFRASALADALFIYKGDTVCQITRLCTTSFFNAVTDAMETLNQVQIESEEIYIDSGEKEEHKTVKLEIVERNISH